MTNQLTEVRKSYLNPSQWVVSILGDSGYVRPDGTRGEYYEYNTEAAALKAETLFLDLNLSEETSAGKESFDSKPEIRKFETGATRDTVVGKLDYVRALSPIVLRRYVEYLDKHRLQPDGGMREFDNWKKGIPQETYHSSGGRHFFTSWLLFEDYEAFDNHGPVDEEDALCGQLFNTMGRLHEILEVKLNATSDRTKPVDGGY